MPEQTLQHTDEVNVIGTLACDAQLTFTGEPHQAVLAFQICPSRGLPYLVRQVIGAEPAAQEAARHKARLLKKNTPVRVYARGMRFQSDHDVAGLRLLDVTAVIPLAIPEPHIEAHHAQES
jgi:hypothetical protein